MPESRAEKVERIRAELRAHGAKAFVEARLQAFDVGELVNDLQVVVVPPGR